ncbi:4-hydroxythreonine-4-phosphate dehydrogenase PdxA [Telmatospirillum siberiense]|uniref:4-hydroxythreonine-4-phosphate dehydrogenase n=1 Tax=Telmatospirillum siberiense TaxID=382514 RepID=A0A2N3Q089_9PROT|nr:4-hydroxythreonine-4-phosphate dehydrogenase PdxA [Telmatospirillum siberiense]PKU26069.1 4-hydroxythreonine-4-phosphate dehydrogenase PdxA [Telmatospirillum siberiense]
MTKALPLALTMGEPAGIGGDIALAAWRRRKTADLAPFFLIDDADRVTRLADRLDPGVRIQPIDHPEQALACFDDALPVLHRSLPSPSRPGITDPANAQAVIAAIEEAVRLTRSGQAAAVVTNPIHKKVLYDAGFPFPGHTEFLAALAESPRVVMMLAAPQLKVVPVTVHLPLRAAIAALSIDEIVDTGILTAKALREDFGISSPRLAVAGLNPHAGENGAMGSEDEEIVRPAVESLCRQGIDAFGPLAADTMFHPRARAGYDAALCMYHDQALIPLKTLDFDGGVNVTLGLPFIRTSPDHGTALDLAGSGRAHPDSLIAALTMARTMADHRG